MQEFQEDFYAVLGVEETAAPDDIRKAYLKLAKKLHPDRFPNDPEKKAAAQQEFGRVTRAHEVLGDPRQREEYDGLRILTRSRQALDTGSPGASVPASPSTSGVINAEQKVESKEQWANKHALRAEECIKRKKFQEAETAVKEAIRLDPNKVRFRTMLAEVYLARGWKTLAITEIQAALRLDPQDSEAQQLELKLKAGQRAADATAKAAADKKAGGFLNQLSNLFGKK